MATAANSTVLVIEDDEDIRFVYRCFLVEELGLSVLEAGKASLAIQLLQNNPLIHVALVDLTLPDQSSDQLIANLRAIRPDLRIILLSGRADIRELAKKFEVSQFIRKPFAMAQLVSAVQKEIEA